MDDNNWMDDFNRIVFGDDAVELSKVATLLESGKFPIFIVSVAASGDYDELIAICSNLGYVRKCVVRYMRSISDKYTLYLDNDDCYCEIRDGESIIYKVHVEECKINTLLEGVLDE